MRELPLKLDVEGLVVRAGHTGSPQNIGEPSEFDIAGTANIGAGLGAVIGITSCIEPVRLVPHVSHTDKIPCPKSVIDRQSPLLLIGEVVIGVSTISSSRIGRELRHGGDCRGGPGIKVFTPIMYVGVEKVLLVNAALNPIVGAGGGGDMSKILVEIK